MKIKAKLEETIPQQELTKYNRESGRKTLYFVGALIVIVAALTVCALVLYSRS
jgi:hypothetical protein